MPLHVWRNPHFQSRDFFYDLQSSAAEAHFGIRVVTYAAGSQKCTYTERMLEKKLDFNVLLGKQKYELS